MLAETSSSDDAVPVASSDEARQLVRALLSFIASLPGDACHTGNDICDGTLSLMRALWSIDCSGVSGLSPPDEVRPMLPSSRVATAA